MQQINIVVGSEVPKKVIGDDIIHIFPNTVDDYRTIPKFLIDSKIKFFGLQLKSERPEIFLLKESLGIPLLKM